MKRPQFSGIAGRTHACVFARAKRRHSAVEALEERFALNAAPAALGAQTHANAETLNPSPPSDSATAAVSTQAAADPSGPVSQGILDLLFTPHRPKSGVPADVISGVGPALQQGAPIIDSFELEDNLTGNERGDLRARENLQRPIFAEIVQKELADMGNVNTTPYGMPNFSFGPDTWVFGPQEAASPRRRVMHRPENPGAEVTPPREEASPSTPNEAPGEDRRSSLLLESSLKLGAARSRLDVFASPESTLLDGKAQTGDGITSDAAEELIVDKRAAIE